MVERVLVDGERAITPGDRSEQAGAATDARTPSGTIAAVTGDHGHGHQHGAGLARSGTRHRKRLAIAFAIGLVVLVVEAVAGFVTNSLALLSDAGHMLTDVIGLGMALAAIQLADRHARAERTTPSPHTFGLYRLEILAALVNAVLLFGVAVFVVVEAVDRLRDEPEVRGLADAHRRRGRPGGQPRVVRPAAPRGQGIAERAGRLPRGRSATPSVRSG